MKINKHYSRLGGLIVLAFYVPINLKSEIQNGIISEIAFYGLTIFVLMCFHSIFEVGKYIKNLEDRIENYEKQDIE